MEITPVGVTVIAAIVVALSGCSTEETPGSLSFEASSGTTRAVLDVPEGEAASIGTYVLSIVVTASGNDGAGSTQNITGDRDGAITALWVDDLTGDEHPEIIVAMTSAGSGSYGTCHIYVPGDGEFSRIELAPLGEEQRDGFMGHDAFEVVDGALYRTFPVYASDDANARPSGGVLGYRYDFESATWVAP